MNLKQMHVTKNYELGHFTEELNAICGAFQVEQDCHDHFISGRIAKVRASGLDFAFISQNASQIRRSEQNIRKDPGNHYFLIVQDEGFAGMCHAGTEIILKPGDMFLVDSTQTSEFYYKGQHSRQISLHLSRDEMFHRYGTLITAGTTITRHDRLGRAMRSILQEVLYGDQQSQLHLIEPFYGVFGALLMHRNVGQKPYLDPNQLIYDRATNAMSQNFTDPDFGVAELARHLNISTRKLQRVFQSKGASPSQSIQKLRVQAARLKINANVAQSIATIAFDCGFSDLSTFYRQYNKVFDESPSKQPETRRKMQ